MRCASVVIPVYNGYKWLDSIRKSIQSNLGCILEVILVNDGDNQDFRLLADDLEQEFGEIIVRTSTSGRCGPAIARNQGMRLARGDYIAFLDCDDLWLDGSLEKRLQVLSENPNAEFVYGSFINRDENSGSESINMVPRFTRKEDLYFTNHICLPTVIFEAPKVIEFDNVKHEDLDLWLRALSGNKFAVGCLDVCVIRRLGFESVSSSKLQSSKWHLDVIMSHLKKIERLFVPVCMIIYLINGILKRRQREYRPIYFGMNRLLRSINRNKA